MHAQVARWLADFERSLAAGDARALEALFRADSHWRDLVALTWQVTTVSGSSTIAKELPRRGATARGFEVDPRRTPPREVKRAGTKCVEAIYRFETDRVRGQGVLRLIPDGEAWKCWSLLTALDEIKGFEEHVGSRRPRGEAYSRDFAGPNWLDKRKAASAYADREPTVLIVGGGHAGLSIAARLRQLGVDALIVDRNKRVGDNWRNRYHALTLHNQVQVNHLPYMPYPPSWPTYIPKDKLANWFEAYAESLELDFWTETELIGATYDASEGRWTATVRQAGGRTRTLRPRHVVMATGVSGMPRVPSIPTLESFAGRVMHSHDYQDATPWAGRNALVIGTGTSGHDIAQDLHSNGARVSLVQRSPTLVLNVEPSAQLPYTLYDEGIPLEDCDLIVTASPLAVMKQAHKLMADHARELDRDLIRDLERSGFRIDHKDVYGWQFKYLQNGGGYYFNVGASNLVVEGKIPVIQFADIERFVAEGAKMKGGSLVPADLVVLATGYHGLEHLVRKLFGDAVAERVGPIWGFDEQTQELRNMWSPTGQPGLWFIAGSFAQCRIYSKYLAAQIKAREEGLITRRAQVAEDSLAG